jgi:hypothetical protein
VDSQTQIKLARLLGLLGSDFDGEIINAARAIRQLLESKGLTFADLKQTVEKPTLPAVREERHDRRHDWETEREEERHQRERREQRVRDEVIAMARAILRHRENLQQHELKFVKQMLTQATVTKLAMTEKQARWFTFLFSKYGDRDDDDDDDEYCGD